MDSKNMGILNRLGECWSLDYSAHAFTMWFHSVYSALPGPVSCLRASSSSCIHVNTNHWHSHEIL